MEIVKDRLYNVEKRGKEARLSAQYGLYKTLLDILKLMAPVMPFITEELYQLYFKKLEKDESIHISSWPKTEGIKESKEGDVAVDIIAAVRQDKSNKKMPLNTPVKELVIDCKEKLDNVLDDIKGAMKIEKISFGKGDVKVSDNVSVRVVY